MGNKIYQQSRPSLEEKDLTSIAMPNVARLRVVDGEGKSKNIPIDDFEIPAEQVTDIQAIMDSIQGEADAVTAAAGVFGNTHPETALYSRVTSDSGTLDKELISGLFQRFLNRTDTMLLNIESARKVRVSSALQYIIKAYNVWGSTYDAVQLTDATQPFLGGFVAPNEKRSVKFVNGQLQTGQLSYTSKSFLATDAWTLLMVIKVNHRNNTRLYLGSTSHLDFNASNITLNTGSVTTHNIASVLETGKDTILELQYNNGVGRAKINNVPISTTITSGAIEFSRLAANLTYPLDCSIKHFQLTPSVLSEAESQLTYAYLRGLYPEIEGIGIGNQWWATSNYEGITNSAGNVMPEVQSATTDTNAEIAINGTFDSDTSWAKQSGVTISGGAMSSTGATSGANATLANQAITTFKANSIYRVTVVVSAYTSGTLAVSPGGYSFTPNITSIGTFTFYVKPTQIGNSLYITNGSGAAFVGSIDSVSVKEVGWSDSTAVYNARITAGDSTDAATRTSGMWCHYSNLAANGAIYGKLFNGYFAAALSSNPPKGWRVPSKADVVQLVTYCGGATAAAKVLKMDGTAYWAAGNTGTNSTGFSLLPNGTRGIDGSFADINNKAYLWTSDGCLISFDYNTDTVTYTDSANKIIGAAIRLVRNEPNGTDCRVETTGRFSTNISSTAKTLTIPCGYRIREVRISSAVALSAIACNVYDYSNTTLIGNILTGKSVSAGTEMIFGATVIDAPAPYTDRTLRITSTGNTGDGMIVYICLEKVFKS